MDELIPVCLAMFLGVPIGRYFAGRARVILSVLAVAISGVTATTVSGEYGHGYIYLLVDLGEAVLGLAVGFVIAHGVWQQRRLAGVLSSGRR
jgi:hypothetical protein